MPEFAIPADLLPRARAALQARAPADKCVLLLDGAALPDAAVPDMPLAGWPAALQIVSPDKVSHRGLGTTEGRAAMLHAIAHIEFSAINLALDAVCRYPDMPAAFHADWYRVAVEEADHFSRVATRLQQLGQSYGDWPVHQSLWQLADKTAHDVLARMALIPRLMEARGLDATPPILEKFRQLGDADTVAALEIIVRDEIGHVALGDRWFRYLCQQRGLPVEPTYLALIRDYAAPWPRAPFNRPARLAAGFTEQELAELARAGGR